MDAIILTVVLTLLLTVTTVWNTGETGDINYVMSSHRCSMLTSPWRNNERWKRQDLFASYVLYSLVLSAMCCKANRSIFHVTDKGHLEPPLKKILTDR